MTDSVWFRLGRKHHLHGSAPAMFFSDHVLFYSALPSCDGCEAVPLVSIASDGEPEMDLAGWRAYSRELFLCPPCELQERKDSLPGQTPEWRARLRRIAAGMT